MKSVSFSLASKESVDECAVATVDDTAIYSRGIPSFQRRQFIGIRLDGPAATLHDLREGCGSVPGAPRQVHEGEEEEDGGADDHDGAGGDEEDAAVVEESDEDDEYEYLDSGGEDDDEEDIAEDDDASASFAANDVSSLPEL